MGRGILSCLATFSKSDTQREAHDGGTETRTSPPEPPKRSRASNDCRITLRDGLQDSGLGVCQGVCDVCRSQVRIKGGHLHFANMEAQSTYKGWGCGHGAGGEQSKRAGARSSAPCGCPYTPGHEVGCQRKAPDVSGQAAHGSTQAPSASRQRLAAAPRGLHVQAMLLPVETGHKMKKGPT